MDLRNVLVAAYHFSKLSFQSLGLVAKAKYQHRKAKATFKRTLILHGVPSEAALELAKAYPNPVNELFDLMNVRKSSN